MSDKNTLDASCRVALAALLHDLGKFAERARIPEAQIKDADGNIRQVVNEQLYCKEFKGRRTHVHSAYTAIGMDLLEEHLPAIVGMDMSPFASWKDRNTDDSIINAASKHHRPETYLQWIIATADRLASGFERDSFDAYNAASDDANGHRLNHYTTRLETSLERIRLTERPQTGAGAWRYPLKPMSPQAIFPMLAKDIENDDTAEAQKKYLELWNAFKQGILDIPPSHRNFLSLWLDHFESLWLTFTHAIPAATAGIGGNVRPDVSLYDHSKTTAALATALWRYHHDLRHTSESVREQLRAQWDKERADSVDAVKAWNDNKFLLVQGDFFGIQNFIFAEGGKTQKRAAKLLRGRSFYVSLLMELAALKVLDALSLPSTSQVINAAGKFLIVAHNTPEAVEKLQSAQAEIDNWFLSHAFGQSGIGLVWLPVAARDFRQAEEKTSPFRELMKRLFDHLERVKLQRFGLCGNNPAKAVFNGFLDRFTFGVCEIDGHSPAEVKEGGIAMSKLAADQIDTGTWLATCTRVLITRDSLKHNTLRLPIFGFWVNFTLAEEDTGRFSSVARDGRLLRAWDFSLPLKLDAPLWNGYARRYINAYVPKFETMNAREEDRYRGIEDEVELEKHPDEIKTFNYIACDDKQPLFDKSGNSLKTADGHQRYKGVAALMTLKGDVDNLGLIIQAGMENPTFARMAALSRQINAFFTVYLPWLCAKEYPSTYTVFAGGDDFFLVGPWHSTIKLAQRMHEDFIKYAAHNPDIHFSAGLSMTKPGLPVRQLAMLAEHALEEAKTYNPDNIRAAPKNAVTCFGQTVSWEKFFELMGAEKRLRQLTQEHNLSAGYLYALLHYAEKSEMVKTKPQNAIWHSHFAYRTRRFVETQYKDVSDRNERESKRRHLQERLAKEIKAEGIEKYCAAYKIALFTHLYQERE